MHCFCGVHMSSWKQLFIHFSELCVCVKRPGKVNDMDYKDLFQVLNCAPQLCFIKINHIFHLCSLELKQFKVSESYRPRIYGVNQSTLAIDKAHRDWRKICFDPRNRNSAKTFQIVCYRKKSKSRANLFRLSC